MFKSVRNFILLAVLLASSTSVHAKRVDVYVDGIRYIADDSHISSGAEAAGTASELKGDIVIPEKVVLEGNEYVVTSVGRLFVHRYSPRNYQNLTSITLPATIRSIDASAFGVSETLTEIKLAGESDYFTVEDGVLYDKNKTKLIYFPAAKDATGYRMPATVTTIGASAFSNNKSLTAFEVPATVTTIEAGGGDAGVGVYGAFKACSNLTAVTFAEGSKVTRISDFCFHDCTLLETVNFPATVTAIDYYAMNGCSKFRGPLPENLQTIGRCGFQGCTSLTEVIFPATLKSLGSEAFNNCKNIKKVVVPDECSVTRIPSNCFARNSALTDITLSNNITSIDLSAFESCSKLPVIKLPDHLKTIGERAFESCNVLKKVEFQNELETIGVNAFSRCSMLADFTLPASLKTIGDGAFCMAAETELNIPASVTSIGQAAFSRNKQLKAFTVDEANTGYTTIEGVLFTKDLKTLMAYPAASTRNISYTVPGKVETIGAGAFTDATLTHITLPSSLKAIYNAAFADNDYITELTIPASVTQIGLKGNNNYVVKNENIIYRTKIKALYLLNATTPPTLGDGNSTLPTSNAQDLTVYVKKSAYDSGVYQSAEGWKNMARFAYEVPAKMSASGLSTIGRDFDVDLSDSPVTAYLATKATNSDNSVYVTMSPVGVSGKTAGKYIPSRTGSYTRNGVEYESYTGALLKGDAGSSFTYRIGESDEAVTDGSAVNYLTAVTDATLLDLTQEKEGETYTNIVLNGGKFRYVNSIGTIAYNRSYLSMPASLVGTYSAAAPAKQFIFSFESAGSTTGISDLPVYTAEEAAAKSIEPWYNLQGVRVQKPQQGVYIHGGKKVIIK